MSPIAVSMLDPVSMSLPLRSSWSRVKSWANWANSSVKTSSFVVTKTPSSAELPTWSSTVRMSFTVWLCWLTHRTGSVSRVSFPSTAMPAAKIARLAIANGTATRVDKPPSQTTRRPSGPVRKSRPWVGDRYSRMPRIASGNRIEQTQIAMMPTASSDPKSRIIGTFAKCRAEKANTASNVTTSSAGPRFRAVSWIGWGDRSTTTSSSTRACIWIA